MSTETTNDKQSSVQSTTTTKFIGDIMFNDGEKDVLVSDLATVDEVNEVLEQYVKKGTTSNIIPYPSNLITHVNEEYLKYYTLTPVEGINKIHVEGSLTSRMVEGATYEFNFDVDLPSLNDTQDHVVWTSSDGKDNIRIFVITEDNSKKYEIALRTTPSGPPPSVFDVNITIDDKYITKSTLPVIALTTDVFVASDPNPDEDGAGYDFNTDFTYDDNSSLSTLATKILINKICTNLLNNYVLNSVLSSTLSDYVDNSTLTSKLSEYIKNDILTSMIPYPEESIKNSITHII